MSIVAPFCLGGVPALYLYPRLSDDGVTFTGFALFMGAAMSITAFPVLARILSERGLVRSRMGTLAIARAAVDDVTGWCILAYIVVLVRVTHAARPAWVTIAGSLAYVLIMVFVVRRILPAFEREFRKRNRLSDNLLAVIVVLVLVSALATEWLGIHLLFGAFLMGAIIPKTQEFTHSAQKLVGDHQVVMNGPSGSAAPSSLWWLSPGNSAGRCSRRAWPACPGARRRHSAF